MEIQIVSGFLGAGKTTFLNQYLPVLQGRTVVIENEFGDVGLDGDLIYGDLPVKELFAGCICCSLALDFRKGIKEIWEQFHPDRIVIEPSGVGRLSDIVKACGRAKEKEGIDLRITKLIAVVDLSLFEDYIDGFGAFYLDQIQHARLVLLSNLEQLSQEEKLRQIARIREVNPDALVYEGDFRQMDEDALMSLLAMTADHEEDPEEIAIETVPADKVFSSIAVRDPGRWTQNRLEECLEKLKSGTYGRVLRIKGIVEAKEGGKMHVEVTPASTKIELLDEESAPETKCKIIVIGCGLMEDPIRECLIGI